MNWFFFTTASSFLILVGCQRPAERLPILSKSREVEGKVVYDQIPDFEFIGQDSNRVTNATFAGKAYVADFFFTSCPTICPVMTRNMLKIYERFQDSTQLLLLSHTIDPRRDTVGRLRQYAQNLGVRSDKWFFVTGNKDEIYDIADDYFNVVIEDPTLPAGFDHSGRFVLVDPQRHIRAYCQGTDSAAVEKFMEAIETLLDEI
ncbi:MAG: SCO family protein [Phaeodactylibacter sp.]|nr:SCO family protein [Phaeodactylibacter sp.]MCB9293634.1 SCO family protein [Lewinellaceae bacterium]